MGETMSGIIADHVVDTIAGELRVRSTPVISKPPTRNVIAELPDNHPVRVLSDGAENGFREIETELSNAYVRDFVSARYLKKLVANSPPPVSAPMAAVGMTIPAAILQADAGAIAKRTAKANAFSLNESGQPSRSGGGAQENVDSLNAIVDWLDSENTAHTRYISQGGKTYCNIYAHDYCYLSGVYLPRVWWEQGALLLISKGNIPRSSSGSTVYEMNANALHDWFNTFGPNFGWRRTFSLTELQDAANAGSVCIIASRRRDRTRSGHIVAVVPETPNATAVRKQGQVVTPVQSQAGARNFRRRAEPLSRMTGSAEYDAYAYWIHD